jgi:hypothetical protein
MFGSGGKQRIKLGKSSFMNISTCTPLIPQNLLGIHVLFESQLFYGLMKGLSQEREKSNI